MVAGQEVENFFTFWEIVEDFMEVNYTFCFSSKHKNSIKAM
jgi:hypothetical protein